MRGPMFAVGCALAMMILLFAVIGQQGDTGPSDREVAEAAQALDEEARIFRSLDEGHDLIRRGERECAEASYLCDSVAALNKQTGAETVEMASSEVTGVEARLDELDPEAVAEAER